jgi:hypothetical protein
LAEGLTSQMSQILKKSLDIGIENEIRSEQWNIGYKKFVKRKMGDKSGQVTLRRPNLDIVLLHS